MITVDIKAHDPYKVYIGGGLLDRSGTFAREHAGGERAIIVTDSCVSGLYLDRAVRSFTDAGYLVTSYVFCEGEKSKNSATLIDLLEQAARDGLTRSDIFVALGGGVTGDLCGLAASLYMRGVGYVGIPTTLLAAVDSSVGGKTAIDLEAGKNLCGTFWQPKCVVCDPDLLATLYPGTFSDGMAEVIKYGVICDHELFRSLGDPSALDLSAIIERCVRIKSDVVSADEFDNARRAVLNFGHTFGHAIEKLSGYSISHGRAVASGMVLAAKASTELGLCPESAACEIEKTLRKYSLSTDCPFTADDIIGAAMSDKKKNRDGISLVLITEIGKSVVKQVSVNRFGEICRKVIVA